VNKRAFSFLGTRGLHRLFAVEPHAAPAPILRELVSHKHDGYGFAGPLLRGGSSSRCRLAWTSRRRRPAACLAPLGRAQTPRISAARDRQQALELFVGSIVDGPSGGNLSERRHSSGSYRARLAGTTARGLTLWLLGLTRIRAHGFLDMEDSAGHSVIAAAHRDATARTEMRRSG
jgi:hypothetical protein